MNKITRRKFMGSAGAGLAGMTLANNVFARASQSSASLPNFIIILTDDQGYQDLGCFGHPTIKTPNIDQMAAEGTKFTDFYAAASICSPTRATVMTGCYGLRVGISGIFYPNSTTGIHPDEITIAEQLKTVGYATACIGKWHLGHEIPFLPTSQGFDYYYGVPWSHSASPLIMENTEIVEPANTDVTLLTQKYTTRALAFIEQNKDKPFFLYLPHSMPHNPVVANPLWEGTSAGGVYGDVIEEIDWSTGQILQKLKDLGIDNNTFVIFTSDNGAQLAEFDPSGNGNGGSNDPLRGAKTTPYEGGHRVPCIMRWPGTIPAGRVCPEIATTMEFYTTLSSMAGVSLPTDRIIDGHDIADVITGVPGAVSPYKNDDVFVYEKQRGQGYLAVRRGPWKWHRDSGELYNLENDIGETTDVSAANAALCTELEDLLWAKTDYIKQNTRPKGDMAMLDAVKRSPAYGIKNRSSQNSYYYNVLGQRVSNPGLRNSPSTVYIREKSKKKARVIIK
jgi:arylsulfatase A-like enzyme